MLTLIRETRKLYTPSGSSRKMALYRCSCGKTKEICVRNVRIGATRSCGCLNKKQITALGKIKGNKRANYKHGMFGTRFHSIFFGMKNRCENNSIANKHVWRFYGEKGIKCHWKDFFEFKKDMYESYLGHVRKFGEKQTTIDRINSKKNYCKSNCRWATYKEQAREKVGKSYLAKNFKKTGGGNS